MNETDFIKELKDIHTKQIELEKQTIELSKRFFLEYPKLEYGTKVEVVFKDFDNKQKKIICFIGNYKLYDIDGMYVEIHKPRKDNGKMSITVHRMLKCREITIKKLQNGKYNDKT